MVWADNASSITCLAVPTSRNLAGGHPGVNKFGCLGYANVRQNRLLSPGTRVFRHIPPCLGMKMWTCSKFTHSPRAFILPAIDIGKGCMRDSSNRRAAGQGGRSAPFWVSKILRLTNPGESCDSGPASQFYCVVDTKQTPLKEEKPLCQISIS
jgi:hypothetical protein